MRLEPRLYKLLQFPGIWGSRRDYSTLRKFTQGVLDHSRKKVALVVKHPPANAGDLRDMGSIPGLGRSPGGGHGNPLQKSCLENPMDRETWQFIVHWVSKRWTQRK